MEVRKLWRNSKSKGKWGRWPRRKTLCLFTETLRVRIPGSNFVALGREGRSQLAATPSNMVFLGSTPSVASGHVSADWVPSFLGFPF